MFMPCTLTVECLIPKFYATPCKFYVRPYVCISLQSADWRQSENANRRNRPSARASPKNKRTFRSRMDAAQIFNTVLRRRGRGRTRHLAARVYICIRPCVRIDASEDDYVCVYMYSRIKQCLENSVLCINVCMHEQTYTRI